MIRLTATNLEKLGVVLSVDAIRFSLTNRRLTTEDWKKMLNREGKNITRQRVHDRIRKKLQGTSERPRLNVYRSLNHIYVQVIDDLNGKTLVSASSAEGEGKKTGGNVAAAKGVGKAIAERAKAKGITKVVFDRGGYIYHGRVKALADAAREGGLKF